MESKIKVSYSSYVGEKAIVQYENEQIIILVKPKVARIMFGMIGQSIAGYKELCRIGINEISSLITKEKGSKLEVIMELNSGKKCKLFFKGDDPMKKIFIDRFDGKVAIV